MLPLHHGRLTSHRRNLTGIGRRHLHAQTVVAKSDGPPKRLTILVAHEHIDSQTWYALPSIAPEPGYSVTSNAVAPKLGAHEQLPEIDMLGFPPKQRIAHNDGSVFKHNGFVPARTQPARHSFRKPGRRHAIAMPLIVDELGIERSKQLSIFGFGETDLHVVLDC